MTRVPIDDENDSGADPTAPFDPGAPDESAPPPAAAGDLDRLQAERDSLFERLARATADFKNTQKRLQGEFDQRVQYANSGLIKALLPVIDNFERALAVDAKKVDAAGVLKGLQIVHDQLLAVLKKEHVEEIAPAPGTPFDPNHHEALMQQDAPQYAGQGPTVTQVLQKGYALHDRTLRPAQVAVSRSS